MLNIEFITIYFNNGIIDRNLVPVAKLTFVFLIRTQVVENLEVSKFRSAYVGYRDISAMNYVQLDLGADLLEQSEREMSKLCLGLRRKYPEISYVLCGFSSTLYSKKEKR